MADGRDAVSAASPLSDLLRLLAAVLMTAAGAGAQDPAPAAASREEAAVPAATGGALEAGWAAFECGDLAAADAAFREAAEAGESEGWRGRAEVARRRGRGDEAVWAFREYLSREPSDLPRRLEFARLLSWEGLHEEAIVEFRTVEAGTEDPALLAAARRGRADALAWSGSHRDALSLYAAEWSRSEGDPELARAIGEVESWHGRDGAAAHWFARSLQERQDGRVRGMLEDAERRLRPEAFAQVQAFADDADWKRGKVLLGGSGRLFPETRPDARTELAVEYASFEEASGRSLGRSSLVARHRDRPSPFSAVEVDAAYGDTRGAESWRGGVALDGQLRDRVWAWGSVRRDDWIDPIASRPFDRYNGAFTVDLQRAEIVQATTLRGGLLVEDARGAGALAELSGGPISDGNGRLEAYAQLHRANDYAPGRRSIPRIYYHHLGFDDASPLYYSPENLDSWGVGWRWEAREEAWNAYADASWFWQTGTVGDWGMQLGAGVEREFAAGFRLRLEANFLSTDDRGLPDRYEAYAVALTAVVPF